ncbi:hypothetical protein TPELB_21350 [Terrisporobacter petrolearius]|uniref:Uncharacterized protein n=2 Tax=Terrisporobacter petrolearius TaxID=1460447 RepID=A0ABZ3FDD4_9FIRM
MLDMNKLNEIVETERMNNLELDARCRAIEIKVANELNKKAKEVMESLEILKTTAEKLMQEEKSIQSQKRIDKQITKLEVYEVLMDTVEHNEKPQGAKIGAITKRLPRNKVTLTIEQIAEKVTNGHSWKASVLSTKSDTSFESTKLVALDIDNKESYTSIKDFLAINSQFKPCLIYKTFSSTEEHERYRVIFAFNKLITDYNEACSLYELVREQYSLVDIDESVGPGKILFGGTEAILISNDVNEMPQLNIKEKLKQQVSYNKNKSCEIVEALEISDLDIIMNLEKLKDRYKGIKLDIDETFEWINQNVKITDVLGIEENKRFKCICEDHEDNNPSARITTYDNEQVYICSCSNSGLRLIGLLSKILDKSAVKTIHFISQCLGLQLGSNYQRETTLYIANIRRHIDKMLKGAVADYLHRRKLYDTYRLIIDFADANIPFKSLSKSGEVVFFLSKRELGKEMNNRKIKGSGSSGTKLIALCELGLLKKLTDEEIRVDALNISRKYATNNRIDYYELVDLSPSVISAAELKIRSFKTCAIRQKGNNANRRAAVLGAEEVNNNINVQSNINISDNKKNKFISSSQELLQSKKYFTEDELRKSYNRKDKNVSKFEAEKLALDFVPILISEGRIKRIRVNTKSRKEYGINAKVKSNSFVYIAA